MATLKDRRDSESYDQLQARLFLLISQYSVTPNSTIAGQVVDYLTRLCRHPHISLFPDQGESYARMINFWRARYLE